MAVEDFAGPSAEPLALRYWRAVAELPTRRAAALSELEACFRDGGTPGPLEGVHSGRVLATTLGFGLDAPVQALARLWMPWKGKAFDPEAREGRNMFTRAARPPMRVLWPGYSGDRDEGPARISAFRFTTWEGPGAVDPTVRVLKIDYDHDESPELIIRPILDELVRIDDGLYLGQALMNWRAEYHRVAWFALNG